MIISTDMIISSTFSGRVQFTALSITFRSTRIARVKLPKMFLGDVLKEVIEWGSIIGSVKSKMRLKMINIRNSCKIFRETGVQLAFWKATTEISVLKYSQFEMCKVYWKIQGKEFFFWQKWTRNAGMLWGFWL